MLTVYSPHRVAYLVYAYFIHMLSHASLSLENANVVKGDGRPNKIATDSDGWQLKLTQPPGCTTPNEFSFMLVQLVADGLHPNMLQCVLVATKIR